MHIPDSVLSPATSAICGVAMTPVWTLAAHRVRATLGTRQAPLLALGSAFCFTVMMFNIPALGGTTAHPVAGCVLAVLLGPWAAVIGVSVALAIQALFFGDGGLLAYGANCFTMAFVLPFVGYSVYRLLAWGKSPDAPSRAVCAAIGSYIGLNAAAAVVAVLLGIQPALFRDASGHPLYFPFGLHITLPAMLGAHLFIAGPAEALVTAVVVRYLQVARIPLYDSATACVPGSLSSARSPRFEVIWVGLLALVALSPLGLLAKGEAWGEWDVQGLRKQIQRVEGQDYVPRGAERAEAHSYKGLAGLADYASDKGAKGYIAAGLIGVGAISCLLLIGGRLLARREDDIGSPEQGPPNGGPGLLASGDDPGADARPDWLLVPSDQTAPPPDLSGRAPNRFLERTLGDLSTGAALALNGEPWARKEGYLQRRDPRAKVIAFLFLIGVVTCVHHIVTLALIYCLTLLLASASRLPIGMLVRRVWLSVPLFVGAVALPTLFSVVTPGKPLFTLWRHPLVDVTLPGLTVAALLTLRVGVAVSLATLLTLTTSWTDLLRALRTLCVPRLFISVLAMTYRYLAALLQTAGEMFEARHSRTVGRATNGEGRRFAGAAVGALFGKTLALSEEVHSAMLSRGFTGEMPTLTVPRWRASDSLWAMGVLIAAVAALGGEYAGLLH